MYEIIYFGSVAMCYIFIGSVVGFAAYRIDGSKDPEMSQIVGAFWPLSLPFFAGFGAVYATVSLFMRAKSPSLQSKMKCKIEIEKHSAVGPVAFVNEGSSSVYWPGKNGACLSSVTGEKTVCDHSKLDFNTLPGYKPLYQGDVIRIIKEIVL